MGKEEGTQLMSCDPHSVLNRIVSMDGVISFKSEKQEQTEEVQMETVDHFAFLHRIGMIDLLKTDTEGYDAEVLKGGESYLHDGKIFLILVEVGFSEADRQHSSFDAVRRLLKDYEIVGFYDQGSDGSFSTLDRTDALLINRQIARSRLVDRWA